MTPYELEQQKINEMSGGRGFASLTAGQKASLYDTTITGEALQPATPISVPPPPAPVNQNAAVAGAAAGATYTTPSGAVVDEKGKTVTPAPAPTPAPAEKSLADRIKDALGIGVGLPTPPIVEERLAEQTRLEEAQGLKAKEEELNKANAELSAAQAEFDALQMQKQYIPEAMQQQAEGRGITAGGLAPLTAAELRKNALASLPVAQKVLVASAKVNAAQGRYDLAEKNINKILELEDKTRTDTYNWKKDLYERAKEIATKDQELEIAKAEKAEDKKQKEADDFSSRKKDAITKATTENDFISAGKIALAKDDAELALLIGQIKPAPAKATATEQTKEIKGAAIQKATPFLEQSRGTDGYVDPSVYLKLRSDYGAIVGSVSEFDAIFAPMLSPQERARLGIGKATGLKAVEGEEINFENI